MKEKTADKKNNRTSSRLSNIFRSLRYRNYRLFFIGQSISLIGTWIQRIAMPWLVYHLTDSPFLLGVVGFTSQIASFLLSPIAGVLTDRLNRYHILLVAQGLAMLESLTLSILFFTGVIEIWHIICLSLFLGCINAFEIPVRHSLMIDMIENKEDLGNAIALNSTMVNVARLIGPALAGILIAVTGEGICFIINSLSYFIVIIFLLQLKLGSLKTKKKDSHVIKDLKEGFLYTFGFAPIRAIILLLALISLMGGPYAVLMPVFVKEILHGGAHTFGFLMGASGFGALIGAMYLASRKSVLGLGKVMPISAVIFGLALVAFSFSGVFWLCMILMFFSGIGMILHLASGNTILQTIVENDKRGRVMSFYTMAFIGSAPFGSLLAGFIASRLGVEKAFIIGGISCIIGGIIFLLVLSSLREKVRPIYMTLGIIPAVAEGIRAATELADTPEE